MDPNTDQLRSQFEEFDLNGDGLLDSEEFHDLLGSLGVSANPDLIEIAFGAIDLNSDGRIDFTEFCGWWKSRSEDG
ncbi:MAG TPA: EF-hand domain-containing protein [Polyangiaceae bacterium]|nr:EF-hand domain-containing protein [Polyangiaceae bacterium]